MTAGRITISQGPSFTPAERRAAAMALGQRGVGRKPLAAPWRRGPLVVAPEARRRPAGGRDAICHGQCASPKGRQSLRLPHREASHIRVSLSARSTQPHEFEEKDVANEKFRRRRNTLHG